MFYWSFDLYLYIANYPHIIAYFNRTSNDARGTLIFAPSNTATLQQPHCRIIFESCSSRTRGSHLVRHHHHPLVRISATLSTLASRTSFCDIIQCGDMPPKRYALYCTNSHTHMHMPIRIQKRTHACVF